MPWSLDSSAAPCRRAAAVIAESRYAGMNSLCRRVLRARVLHLVGIIGAAPADAAAWYRLGMALAELGDRAGALLALRSALLHDSTHSQVHRALGRLLFDCGQVERALQCFEYAASCERRAASA